MLEKYIGVPSSDFELFALVPLKAEHLKSPGNVEVAVRVHNSTLSLKGIEDAIS